MHSTVPNRKLLRLAAAMHRQFIARRAHSPLVELPGRSWDRCCTLMRQIHRARIRGWLLAESSLKTDLGRLLPSFQSELSTLQHGLVQPTRQSSLSLKHLYQDLTALETEFDEFEYDIPAGRVSVTTSAIVLEGVYLGPFKIELDWGSRSGERNYRVIATDPHPAESRDDVTHPHVVDEVLCEGDGRHAILQARSQGRLLDFFLLVAGILRTYNSESPYVELALWRGVSCADCGGLVEDDESYSCRSCGSTVCSGCECSCGGCNESYCTECIRSCNACQENYCSGCLKPCNQCQERVCSDCLDDSERCPKCHEEEPDDEDENECECRANADSADEPHSLGQAPAPA